MGSVVNVYSFDVKHYAELKRNLRIAKLELASVPGVDAVGPLIVSQHNCEASGRVAVPPSRLLLGGAADRWQKRQRNHAMGRVRRAKKELDAFRKHHGIVEPKFAKPVIRGGELPPRVVKLFSKPKHMKDIEWMGWKGSSFTRNGIKFY